MKEFLKSNKLRVVFIIWSSILHLVGLQFASADNKSVVPFNVNEIIKQVSHHHCQPSNPPSRDSDEGRFDQPLIPNLTGEFLIDTSIVYVPALYGPVVPAVAFDGTNYLVVWSDGREYEVNIYGARVTQSGVILDPAGIRISAARGGQYWPAVAFDGTNYLVVWEDLRIDPYGDIYGSRVNQSGVVLDQNGIPISTVAGFQKRPSVAFDGINYLVVWGDGSLDIYGARVSQSGVVLDPNGIAISTAANIQLLTSVAFDGTNYFVVWGDGRAGSYEYDIYGTRVSPDGVVLDPNGIQISTTPGAENAPSIAFDGINYLVVWEKLDGSNSDIYGARVNQNGVVLDSSGILITNAENWQRFPTATFDGINYLVTWIDDRNGVYSDIYGARINRSGVVLDSTGKEISIAPYNQWFPAAAFDGTNFLVVWEDYRSDGLSSHIYSARINQSGIILDSVGILVSTAANDQSSPCIAFDGTNYLVAWEDRRGLFPFNIYGSRVTQSGLILDPKSITISTALGDQSNPSVAFDGTNFFIVWEDYRNGYYSDIYGARITQEGRVLDSSGIAISTAVDNQSNPSVAFDGTNYLVVWNDLRTGSSDIYGARVSQSGFVLDPNGIAISTAIRGQYSPAVAFDGTNYLTVWYDYRNNIDYSDIYGARITSDGVILDSNGIAISTARYSQYSPSIAFDGTNYLVVWEDGRRGSNADVYASRVSQTGIVLDTSGIAFSTAADDQYSTSVVFNGTNYLIVWIDWRSGSPYIYGATVSSSGQVIDSFQVSTQFVDPWSFPALARGIGNQVLVTYSGWTSEYQGRTYNTVRIWGKFYPFIGVDERSTLEAKRATLKIYPNPAKAVVRIRSPLSVKDIKIYDVSGKLVKEILRSAQNEKEIVISLKGINSGVYFVKVGKETEKLIVKK